MAIKSARIAKIKCPCSVSLARLGLFNKEGVMVVSRGLPFEAGIQAGCVARVVVLESSVQHRAPVCERLPKCIGCAVINPCRLHDATIGVHYLNWTAGRIAYNF